MRLFNKAIASVITASSLLLAASSAMTAHDLIALGHKTRQMSGRKHALLIGISKYHVFFPKEDETIPDLHCEGDIEAVKELLAKNFGFSDSDITVLTSPEQTKRQAIIEAFESLIRETRPGDTVYVHYSGHGSRVPDPTMRKLDGYLESIVPSDVNLKDQGDNFNEITDSELAKLIDKLADKNPAIATFTFDCCNSGTITRSEHATRGFPAPPALESSQQRGTSNTVVKAVRPLVLSPRRNIAVLSACTPDQLAHEYPEDNPKMGLFTHAMKQALSQSNGHESYTYRDLVNDMTVIMSENDVPQIPQIDGPADLEIMSNEPVPTDISHLAKKNGDELTLNAGYLQGVTKGSKFELFSRLTKELKNARPVMVAEVSDVKAGSSTLTAVSGDAHVVADRELLKAKESVHRYDDQTLVCMNDVDKAIQDILAPELKGCAIFDASHFQEPGVKQWDVELTEGPGGALRGTTRDGRVLFETVLDKNEDSKQMEQLIKISTAIHKEALWQFLKDLKNDQSNLDVGLQLIPYKATYTGTGPAPDLPPDTPEGQPLSNIANLKEGDYFKLRLTNNSDKPIYITILDVEPDGTIEGIYPLTDEDVLNYTQLAPGKTWDMPKNLLVTGPTFGSEQLKLIATTSKADFRPLLQEAKQRSISQTPMNPIVRLTTGISSGTRSAIADTEPPPEDWTVSSIELHTQKR